MPKRILTFLVIFFLIVLGFLIFSLRETEEIKAQGGVMTAMKTMVDGFFYVPILNPQSLKVVLLFDDPGLEGDQIGTSGEYLYKPDGTTGLLDFTLVNGKTGLEEGDPGWEYMADCNLVKPDSFREVDLFDQALILTSYGHSGTYTDINDIDPTTVTIEFFDAGGASLGEFNLNSIGMCDIPAGATEFWAKKSGAPIGAYILFYPNPISPPSPPNVWGWAWSENTGWLSFNNTSGGGAVDYGVNIDPVTGDFSGFTWSENIGWISFNRADAGNPPNAPFNGGSGPIVQLDLSSTPPKVFGWAKALSADGNGWDGWIKLRCNGTECATSDYGVWLDIGATPYEFRGFAWGSDVVGWISFNDLNTGAAIDYQVTTSLVFNQPPYVESGSAIITGEDYCKSSPTGQVSIRWDYMDQDGDDQSQYNFQVATDSGFTNIILDYTASQSIVPGLGDPYGTSAILVVSSPTPGEPEISYTGAVETRYWRVKVQDTAGNWSLVWEEGPSFEIPSHAKPRCDFVWSPKFPSTGEVVQFTDTSKCYDDDNNIVPCDEWSWIFKDGDPPHSSFQNQETKFASSGSKNIRLKVWDLDNSSCSIIKPINIQLPLPGWREIPPF